jgi:hypothetical protein
MHAVVYHVSSRNLILAWSNMQVASGEILPPGSCPHSNHSRHPASNLGFILASSIFSHSDQSQSILGGKSSDLKQVNSRNAVEGAESKLGLKRIHALSLLEQNQPSIRISSNQVAPIDPKAGRKLTLPSLASLRKDRIQPSSTFSTLGKILRSATAAAIDRPSEPLQHRNTNDPSVSSFCRRPRAAIAAPAPFSAQGVRISSSVAAAAAPTILPLRSNSSIRIPRRHAGSRASMIDAVVAAAPANR